MKLRYVVVIPMLFKLVHQKMGGHPAYFQAIVPQSMTCLCRKLGSIENNAILSARAYHA